MFLNDYVFHLGRALLLVAALGALVLWRPELGNQIMQEDQLVENLGTAALFVAFCVGLVGLVRGAGPIALVFCVLGGLGCLSEISFGERIFAFTAPQIQDVKIDAVHDLLQLSWRMVGNLKVYMLLIALLAVLSVAGVVWLWRRSARFRGLLAHRAMPLVAVAATLILLGLVLDFGLGRAMVYRVAGADVWDLATNSYVEEFSEAVGAVALLLGAFKIFPLPATANATA